MNQIYEQHKRSQEAKKENVPVIKAYAITGTFNGSIIFTKSEGDARRCFHEYYNGESIIHIKTSNHAGQ